MAGVGGDQAMALLRHLLRPAFSALYVLWDTEAAPVAKAQFTRQMMIYEFESLFPDDDACKGYLQARRRPADVVCPRCGSDKVWELKSRGFQ